jgi:acetate kinase
LDLAKGRGGAVNADQGHPPGNLDHTAVLTVNAGSSSLRLAAFAVRGEFLTPLANKRYEVSALAGVETLRDCVETHGLAPVKLIAHRLVHGGAIIDKPCLIDGQVEQVIEQLTPLAPLHNPKALAWIRACRALFGNDVPHVAIPDTAFYANLPEVARTYGLPRALSERYGLRRYGFHGLAHQAMWRRWCELRPDLDAGGRVISLQLGAGCSITATARGLSQDTSMGFSPLEGLLMATRAGDIDAGLLLYLQRHAGLDADGLNRLLNEQSGLLGVSGLSADMRVLLASSDPAARLAVELYCYRARKYVGAYLAVLGGADVILFGGGVGENAPAVRERILAGLEWAGIRVDSGRNAETVGAVGAIHDDASTVAIWVMPVDEAQILAREAVAVVKAK